MQAEAARAAGDQGHRASGTGHGSQWLPAAVALTLLLLSACAPTPRSTGSPGADSPTAAGTSSAKAGWGVAPASLAGPFFGVMHCSSETTQFVLTLDQVDPARVSGQIQFQPLLDAPRPAAPQPIAGLRVDIDTGAFTLEAGRMPGAGRGRSLQMQGVFLPDGSGFVALPVPHNPETCTLISARRGAALPREWTHLRDEAMVYFPASREGLDYRRRVEQTRQGKAGTGCDAQMSEWLAQAAGPGERGTRLSGRPLLHNLFSDASFVPVFGRSFHRLSTSERLQLDARWQACWRDTSRRATVPALAAVPGDAFANLSTLPDGEKAVAAIGLATLRDWLNRTAAAGASATGRDLERLSRMSAVAAPLAAKLWPTERQTWTVAMDGARSLAAAGQVRRLLDTELARPLTSPTALDALATLPERARRQFPQVTGETWKTVDGEVAQAINRQAPAVVQSETAAARTVADTMSLHTWGIRHAATWQLLDTATRDRVAQLLSSRRDTLLAGFAAAERSAYQQRVLSQPAGLQALRAGVAYEHQFTSRFGTLSTVGAMEAFDSDRQARRRADLIASRPAILGQVAQASTSADLEAVRQSLLWPGDQGGEAGTEIAAAMAGAMDKVAPLHRLTAGNYLDAIYSGNFAAARRLDLEAGQRYAERLKPMLKLYDDFLRQLGGSGRRGAPRDSGPSLASAADPARFSAIGPLIAVYLYNYGHRYERCLRSPYIEATQRIPRQETEIRQGLFGPEVRRTDLPDDVFVHRYNREFGEAGRAVGVSVPDGWKTLGDLYFSGGGGLSNLQIHQGVREMMDRQPCDGPVILRMEEHMRRYLDHVRG